MQHSLVYRAKETERGSLVQLLHSLLKVKTETLPSEEAQARIDPSSCGAHAIELTAGDKDVRQRAVRPEGEQPEALNAFITYQTLCAGRAP